MAVLEHLEITSIDCVDEKFVVYIIDFGNGLFVPKAVCDTEDEAHDEMRKVLTLLYGEFEEYNYYNGVQFIHPNSPRATQWGVIDGFIRKGLERGRT